MIPFQNPNNDRYEEPFDHTYRFSCPKAIRDLHDMIGYVDEDGAQVTGLQVRAERAAVLASDYLIDMEIDVAYAGEALKTMKIRKNQGLATVPSIDGGGAIRVSCDPAAFPLSADLIVPPDENPLSWVRYASGKTGKLEELKGVGALWIPADRRDVGAKWEAPDHKVYRKVMYAVRQTPGWPPAENEVLWMRVA